MQRYWDWSWDDLVVNDMPDVVDYVRTRTAHKPHYVGHSMVLTHSTPLSVALPKWLSLCVLAALVNRSLAL